MSQKYIDKNDSEEYHIYEHLNNSSSVGEKMTYTIDENTKTTAIPDEDVVASLSELFKALGDPTRVKILSCLQTSDMNVGDIADKLGMTTSAVSHQLRVLRAIKLVKGTKEGKEVRYSLDDDHVTLIMQCGLTHVNEER